MIITPPLLKAGDLIEIVSPASEIDPKLITGAADALSRQGFSVRIAQHAIGHCGSFSASANDRLSDLRHAFTDPCVKAILCSRGGYGCVHLLEALDALPIADSPKWLIGFSDVSALHALMLSKGIKSVHGSMAKALAQHPANFKPNRALIDLLTLGRMPDLVVDPHPYNHQGEATGTLVGGNLAVIQALISTPFSPFRPGSILYIEDIAEPIYKIERILYQLRMAGILSSAAGIILGQFTDYHPDRNYVDMYDMIAPMLQGLNCPVAFGFPIGHIEENLPIVNGATATLTVTPHTTALTYRS